jgi:hypothetical protein
MIQVDPVSQQDVHSQVPVSPMLLNIPALLAVYISIELNLVLRKATGFMFMARRIRSVTNSPVCVTMLSLGAQKKKLLDPTEKKLSTKEIT